MAWRGSEDGEGSSPKGVVGGGDREMVVTASLAVLAAKPCPSNATCAGVKSLWAALTVSPGSPRSWRPGSFPWPALPPASRAEVLLPGLCGNKPFPGPLRSWLLLDLYHRLESCGNIRHAHVHTDASAGAHACVYTGAWSHTDPCKLVM